MVKRTRVLTLTLIITLIFALPRILPIPSAPQLRNESETLRNEITLLKQKTQLVEIGKDQNFIVKNEDALLKVPSGPDLPSLIDELQKLTNAIGLRWVSGSPNKINNEEDTNQWKMTMILEGNYEQILSFSDQLPALQRLVTLEAITMQKLQNNEIVATLTLNFYALNPSDPKE